MATKSILLAVADPQCLSDITQALGADWEATSVPTDTDALAQLEKRSFDALLADFNLGSPDASELLNLTLETRPETVRFLLAYEADLALVAAKVNGSHQILPKPIEPASLKSRIENGVASDEDSNAPQPATDRTAGAVPPPNIPPVYAEVLKALESPDVTPKKVGEIIARDSVLTTEVLRLTNSAYLGLPRNITNPAEAVQSLGLDTVKTAVMALRFLGEHSHLKPSYLSFDQLWQHSTNVAQIARDLVLFETKDRALAGEAFMAGLVHDLGKIVLVTNFDDLYGRVNSLARKQPVPLWDIEKEMFGANHGEIGACLVGMWNLPSAIVDAAALHHEPPRGEQQGLTPLAAVHIANVLEHQLRPNDDCRVAPVIDTAFLNELGLLQRLPVWRAAFANHGVVPPDLETEAAQSESTGAALSTTAVSRTANDLRSPATATRTGTSATGDEAGYASRFWHSRWASAGVAAALLLLLALWIGTQPGINNSEPVYARTPAPAEPPPTASSTAAPETAPAEPQAIPSVAASDEEPAANVAPTTRSEPAVPAPGAEPAPAMAAPATVASVPAQTPAPPKDQFRLNGIIYTVRRPSAIVNGVTVYAGDRVNGATVVKIGRTNVTLQINGEIQNFILR